MIISRFRCVYDVLGACAVSTPCDAARSASGLFWSLQSHQVVSVQFARTFIVPGATRVLYSMGKHPTFYNCAGPSRSCTVGLGRSFDRVALVACGSQIFLLRS